jgi:hypothetical protein
LQRMTPVSCSELKDHFAGTDHPLEHQQNIPELLKAILQRNPNAFKGARTQGMHLNQDKICYGTYVGFFCCLQNFNTDR